MTEELYNTRSLKMEREGGAKLKARMAYSLFQMKSAATAPRLLQQQQLMPPNTGWTAAS
jgi:hypothetical protein